MNTQNIPCELKQLPQWVCTKSDSKVPMKAFTNSAASSTDPQSWSDFKTAVSACKKGYYDYIGFVFADNGLVGIDIDDGFDADGFMSSLATDIISKCQSYTEKSRSGRGFHIIVKGDLPFRGKNNRAGVEIYKSSRYFITTGNATFYYDVVDNQEAIDYVVNTYFPETQKENSGGYTDKIYTPHWENPVENGKIKLRPEYPRINDGSRNLCLTSVAGALHTIGYSQKQTYHELLYINNVACVPPLDPSEVKSICKSITRYKR